MKLPALALIPILALSLIACSTSGGTAASPTSAALAATPAAATAAPHKASPTSAPATTRPRPTQATPPSGLLSSDGDQVEGWLGSYCWLGTCADAGGAPPKAELPQLEVSGDELNFSLSDNATFVRWTVSYAESSDGELITLDEGGEPFDPDAQPQPSSLVITSAEFEPPPAGDWTLIASVQFPGGDLSYAWRVIVE